MRSLLADVVTREPLAAADGRSGSLLERVVLADGRALVVKHLRDGGDWIMRASHDHGRAAELWSSGVLARVPDVIDHAVVGAERAEDGWVVIMRDVSAALVPDHARLSRGDSRRILEAAAALHAEFWDDPPLELCSMADRYRFLSPATARREADGADEVPRLIGRGWERFAEVVPADVAEPVLAVLERPEPFAAALSAFGSTLLQGDLKLGNLGLTADQVVMLDWGTQTGWGPPAVEVAWYLAINWSRLDATREQVLDDFRAAEGDRHDEDALRLALLGGLVQLGWDKALHASGHPDPAIRAREAADLAWWTARARDALAVWSPS
ncbi:MAG TPA: aminoglycoside phosphotransferase [Actinomycetes bacterium]|nr:aminoglycoside phosphotransferase [Actinomycetes bacterium]